AALALGVERVERQRGLARARHAGDHDEALARQAEREVLEVVLARAAHDDVGERLDAVGELAGPRVGAWDREAGDDTMRGASGSLVAERLHGVQARGAHRRVEAAED